jgi:hypothetical protein
MTAAELATRVPGARKVGKGYRCLCPVHESDGKKHDPSCFFADGDTQSVVLTCRAGCAWHDILAAWGLTPADVMNGNGHCATSSPQTFDYADPSGRVVYRKVRGRKPDGRKTFRFEVPDGRGGWRSEAGVTKGLTRHVYRRHELAGQLEVFICEGEKDADRVRALGMVATTNDSGADQWTETHTAQLAGVADVWILEDHDDAGRKRCQAIAASCTAAGMRARIVRLPRLPEHGDVSDWLDAGHTRDEFLAVCAEAPIWTPETAEGAEPLEDLHAFLQRLDQQPPLAWHIDGLIPDEGICLWHGQPRDFKTLCAQEMGLALAAGRLAFNLERFAVPKPLRVAYFTEEDPERLFAARMHWLTATQDAPDRQMFFPFIRKGLSFDTPDDRAWILDKLRESGAVVAIFDPVRSYTGLSDKGPADLRPVAVFLREIQRTTAAKTLLLVHHDTKPPAAPTEGQGRSRSQQASGGGIFSISDCPVSFTKLDWNRVAVFPEDYKLSGNPAPFEVTFETDARQGEHGPQFGSWVRPVAVTKAEHDIASGVAEAKVLAFLAAQPGTWHTTRDIDSGAKVRKGTAGPVLKTLSEHGRVQFCTGQAAVLLGQHSTAHLWAVPAQDNDDDATSYPGGTHAPKAH